MGIEAIIVMSYKWTPDRAGDLAVPIPKLNLLAIAAAFTLSSAAAQGAVPISFSPNGDNNAGSIKCEVPITSLGNITLRGGTASISGKVISIKASSAFIDTPRTVLVGSVLRTEANVTSDPPSVTGIALFLMGDWQDQIDDPSTKDMIFRKEGHIEGRILGIENESLSVNVAGVPQKVPLASVLYIRSPRVFVFKIGLKTKGPVQKDSIFQAEAGVTSFRPTAAARTLSGSVIPQSDRQQDDGLGGMTNPNSMGMGGAAGMPGLGASNTMGGMGGMGGMNNFNRPQTAVPNPQDNSFDDGDGANRFSTIHSKYGDQKMTLPPGILD
jgi:hypothetical protein